MANCPPGPKTLEALIKPEGDIYTKFLLEGLWENPETGISTRWVFNINADVTVTTFYSPGAKDQPPKYALTGTWEENSQLTGYDNFTGMIGQNKIYIKTGKGIVVKGPIVGGPYDGQSFVGAGTWTSGG